MNLSAPHRADPVKDLDSGGDTDSHRGDRKEAVGVGIHAHGEHVVRPDAETYKTDTYRCGHHDRISENRFAGKDRNDCRQETKSWNDQYVDFRIAKDPEEVQPKHS